MKIFIFITFIVFVLIVVFQSFMVMAVNKTEEQKYSVILEEKNFEIRFYPSATLATISSDAKTYKELSGSGFRKLAAYIFGGNEEGTQIAMTSPVHMNVNKLDSTSTQTTPLTRARGTKADTPAPPRGNAGVAAPINNSSTEGRKQKSGHKRRKPPQKPTKYLIQDCSIWILSFFMRSHMGDQGSI